MLFGFEHGKLLMANLECQDVEEWPNAIIVMIRKEWIYKIKDSVQEVGGCSVGWVVILRG